jgi:CHAT domain-containing protein
VSPTPCQVKQLVKVKAFLVSLVAVLLGVAVLVGGGVLTKSSGTVPAVRLRNPPQSPERKQLRELGYQGNRLFQTGRYLEAAEVFEKARQRASQLGDTESEIHYLNNLGACRVRMFQYRPGMNAYLEARELAQRLGDREMATTLAFNISALYLEMRDLNAALQAVAQGLAGLNDKPTSKYRPKFLVQLARLRARIGDMEAAVPVFYQAIEEADRHGDSATQALAWNQLGYELLLRGELAAAESPLLEAFRLRKMTRDKAILLSYRTLSLLRLAQGDLASAGTLIEQAILAAPHSPPLVPIWQLYYDRGRIRKAQGKLAQAAEDFRAALELAARWRLEVLPADSVRVSLEVGLHGIYSSFIEAGNLLYSQTGRSELVRETFQAAEENRAASLRDLLAEPEDWRRKLPPQYDETLGELRSAEISLVSKDTPSTRDRIQRLLNRLGEMEQQAGLDSATPSGLPRSSPPWLLLETQRILRPDEAFLSFHLGEGESYLWGLTREDFQLCRLPSRSRIRDQVGRFVRALMGGSDDAQVLGKSLYEELLGGLKPAALRKPNWLLALDDVLFELPFPALVMGSVEGRPLFLIERHAVEITPSAHMLISSPQTGSQAPWRSGPFIGLGDPVYNMADPRWRSGLSGAAGTPGKPQLEMTRLAGSGREIRACARLGSPASVPPVLLEGPDASVEALRKALERRPSVLHLATHIVARQRRGLIALSLLPGGDAQLLSPLEIASWRVKLGLVVLSGCSSGQAQALPGSGLMGLTRAWLAAGASAVVVSRWPTSDDSGEFFLAFYKHLRAPSQSDSFERPGRALQRAQLEMLGSRTWRSLPRYWAAYFLIGRGRG